MRRALKNMQQTGAHLEHDHIKAAQAAGDVVPIVRALINQGNNPGPFFKDIYRSNLKHNTPTNPSVVHHGTLC